MSDQLSVNCTHCGNENAFDQPYAYHAGFSEQGFLYDDSGKLTLVWSAHDPAFEELFPSRQPWSLNEAERTSFEEKLCPTRSGDRWRFKNPARCMRCGNPISPPMTEHIYYLVYPDSIVTDQGGKMRLNEQLC